MTTLGDILLEHYSAPGNYTDAAVAAAVEELEKHADAYPDLVARVELAIMRAGHVDIPWEHIDEVHKLVHQLKENA